MLWKRQSLISNYFFLINFYFIFRLRDGLKSVLCLSHYGNEYLQSKTPWTKYKGSDIDR